MSNPAGELYKAKFALSGIMAQSADLYRVCAAAVGFKEDEYGKKSYRWADALLSFRDGLDRIGRDLRCYIKLPEGGPQEAPEVQTKPTAVTPQSNASRDPITVSEAVAVLQRHARHHYDGPLRDAAMKLLDALGHAALLRE
jgi:hypothetical protein